MDIEKSSVAHKGGRLDLGMSGFQPLVRPLAKGLLAEAGVEVVASVDIGLYGVGEGFGFYLGPERLGSIASLRVAVADFPRIAISRSCALALDFSDVRQGFSDGSRVFCGFLS